MCAYYTQKVSIRSHPPQACLVIRGENKSYFITNGNHVIRKVFESHMQQNNKVRKFAGNKVS